MFQELAGHLFYSNPALRAPQVELRRNRGSQPVLWAARRLGRLADRARDDRLGRRPADAAPAVRRPSLLATARDDGGPRGAEHASAQLSPGAAGQDHGGDVHVLRLGHHRPTGRRVRPAPRPPRPGGSCGCSAPPRGFTCSATAGRSGRIIEAATAQEVLAAGRPVGAHRFRSGWRSAPPPPRCARSCESSGDAAPRSPSSPRTVGTGHRPTNAAPRSCRARATARRVVRQRLRRADPRRRLRDPGQRRPCAAGALGQRHRQSARRLRRQRARSRVHLGREQPLLPAHALAQRPGERSRERGALPARRGDGRGLERHAGARSGTTRPYTVRHGAGMSSFEHQHAGIATSLVLGTWPSTRRSSSRSSASPISARGRAASP